MPEIRKTVLDPRELKIEQLNPYETITLYSLKEISIDEYNFVITKEGGNWAIAITELFLAYDINKQDINSAASTMAKSIESIGKNAMTPSVYPPYPVFYFLVEKFLEGLFEQQNYQAKLNQIYPDRDDRMIQPIYKFLSMIYLRYNETISNLVLKGMLEDPYNHRHLVILRDSIQGFNRLTGNGRQKAESITNTLSNNESESKGSDTPESFNLRLRGLYREFASMLVRVLNP
jgi:hypothetical protein